LLTVPPYAVATILTITFAMISERAGRRAPFILASSSLAIIGYIILLTNPDPTHRPGVSYAGTFFAAAGIYPSTALVLSWPANNVSGQTKRATANAMQISIGNLGAVIGTQLYRPKWLPRYFVGHGTALGYMCANIVVVLTIWWVLSRENKRREALEAQGGLQTVDEDEWKGDDDVRWRFTV
jgi:MFS family permease